MCKVKYLLFLFVVFFNTAMAQNNSDELKIDTDYALNIVINLDALMYTDSNVVYAFDKNDLKRNVGDIIYRDSEGNVVLYTDQLQPLITASLKELLKRIIKQESRIIVLETENENLKIQLNNEITRLNQEIENIKREIAP